MFPSGVRFFDRTHTVMFVNTNGNVSFGMPVAGYTPQAFPVADQPMIAPYWADVDVRSATCVEEDGGTGYAGACMNPTTNGVWWNVDPAGRIVVTWDRVGYYQCRRDKAMSFQLVLTPAPGMACGGAGDFDVEFRFNQCEWNTGQASGGTDGLATPPACVRIAGRERCPLDRSIPCAGGFCDIVPVAAQAGFDAGNSRDFVEVAGSRSATIHTTMCTMSNVGEPGIWRYEIRSGVIVCPGAGEACDTGMQGVCAAGRTQCVGGGVECRPELSAGDERCDALDNDCDGEVDDGDLCGPDRLCDRGVCVAHCFEGGCNAGYTCSAEGRCVSEGCDTVECPAGQRCELGACVGACDDVVCPAGRACRAGRCVDLCEGAVCDDCTVCVDGACATRCQFSSCGAGESCGADGRCVESGCESITCPSGAICRSGACVDACEGAQCPDGETCNAGQCVAAETEVDVEVPDAGVDAAVPRPDGSTTPRGRVDDSVDGGAPPAVDTGAKAGMGGCGCVVRGPSRKAPIALIALALLLFVRSRERRSTRRNERGTR